MDNTDSLSQLCEATAAVERVNSTTIHDSSTIEQSYVLTVTTLPWRTNKPNFREAEIFEILDFYQGEDSPMLKGRSAPISLEDRKCFKCQDVFLVKLKKATILWRLNELDPTKMDRPRRWFTVEKYHPNDPAIRKLAVDKRLNELVRPGLLYVPEDAILWLGQSENHATAYGNDGYPSFVGGAWQVLLPDELVQPLHNLIVQVLNAMPLDQREQRNIGLLTMWDVFRKDEPNKDLLDSKDWLKTIENVLGNNSGLNLDINSSKIAIRDVSQKFESHYNRTAAQLVEESADAIMKAHCFTNGSVDITSADFCNKLPSNIQQALKTSCNGWDAAKVNWNRPFRATVKHPFGTFNHSSVIQHPYLALTHGGRGHCIGG